MNDRHSSGLTAARPLPGEDAPAALKRAAEALRNEPDDVEALLLSAAALWHVGEPERATEAEIKAIRAALKRPAVRAAAEALAAGDAAEAERHIQPYLVEHRDDPAGLRLLAMIAISVHRYEDALPLLRKALGLARSFAPARQDLADALAKLGRRQEALEQAEHLLAVQPGFPAYLVLKANIINGMGRYEEAIAIFEDLVARFPERPNLWISYGHDLHTVGRLDEAVAAYRRAIELQPTSGRAWWSLANLKTVRFGDEDIASMTAALGSEEADAEDRTSIHFALGKALEDRGDWQRSFDHYAEGNRIRRARIEYDPDEASAVVRRARELFTPEFFAARAGQGFGASDPIFIVGVQRSGSTLVEQILASHSQIEGTFELPDILTMAWRLGAVPFGTSGSTYPESLEALDPQALRALGEEYLARTRIARRTDRPFFIDKQPNNWAHIGFIHLILPNARIIDVRRHPLDACLANYKQLYAKEQRFTYDLGEMGRYYRDYVEALDHYHEVLPGRIHSVMYERLVDDPEGEIRRLLDHLGLPFEQACLRFHENERAVRTPSAEQVRRPINREGIGRWRSYEPWLDPLKDALGDVLASYSETGN